MSAVEESPYHPGTPENLRGMLKQIEAHPYRSALQKADGPCGIIRMIQRSIIALDWSAATLRAQKALYQLENLQGGVPPDLWTLQNRIESHAMHSVLQRAEGCTGSLRMLEHSICTGDWNLARERAHRVLEQLDNLAAGPPPVLRDLVWHVDCHPLRHVLQHSEHPGGVVRLMEHSLTIGDWDKAHEWAVRALRSLEQLENLARGLPDDLRATLWRIETHPHRTAIAHVEGAPVILDYLQTSVAVCDWATAREWARRATEQLEAVARDVPPDVKTLHAAAHAHPWWPRLLQLEGGLESVQAIDIAIITRDWPAAASEIRSAQAKMDAAAAAEAASDPAAAAEAAKVAASAAQSSSGPTLVVPTPIAKVAAAPTSNGAAAGPGALVAAAAAAAARVVASSSAPSGAVPVARSLPSVFSPYAPIKVPTGVRVSIMPSQSTAAPQRQPTAEETAAAMAALAAERSLALAKATASATNTARIFAAAARAATTPAAIADRAAKAAAAASAAAAAPPAAAAALGMAAARTTVLQAPTTPATVPLPATKATAFASSPAAVVISKPTQLATAGATGQAAPTKTAASAAPSGATTIKVLSDLTLAGTTPHSNFNVVTTVTSYTVAAAGRPISAFIPSTTGTLMIGRTTEEAKALAAAAPIAVSGRAAPHPSGQGGCLTASASGLGASASAQVPAAVRLIAAPVVGAAAADSKLAVPALAPASMLTAPSPAHGVLAARRSFAGVPPGPPIGALPAKPLATAAPQTPQPPSGQSKTDTNVSASAISSAEPAKPTGTTQEVKALADGVPCPGKPTASSAGPPPAAAGPVESAPPPVPKTGEAPTPVPTAAPAQAPAVPNTAGRGKRPADTQTPSRPTRAATRLAAAAEAAAAAAAATGSAPAAQGPEASDNESATKKQV